MVSIGSRVWQLGGSEQSALQKQNDVPSDDEEQKRRREIDQVKQHGDGSYLVVLTFK